MIKSYHIFTPILALALLTGCGQTDEPEQYGEPTPAVFSAQIRAGASRASGTEWAAGDAIGISGVSGAKSYANVKHTTASGDGKFTPAGDAIYYQNAEAVTFTAYYPYAASLGSDGLITASTADQSQQPSFDFLWAQAQGSDAAPAVNFNFRHRMSRINLHFINGNDVDLTDLVVDVDGLVLSGTFDANTGVAAVSPVAGPSTLHLTGFGTDASVIVFPQEANTVTITANADAQSQLYVCPLDLGTLAPGASYNVDITIKKTGMTVTGSAITDWTDGGEYDCNVTIPTPNVGDYYYSDGTYSSEYNASKNVIGIIFYVGHHPKDGSDYSDSGIGQKECHGYVMALSAAHSWNVSWLNIKDASVEIEGISFDADDWNGYANQKAIERYADNNPDGIKFSDFAAAHMCSIYGTTQSAKHSQFNAPGKSSGWFLPSLGQFIGFHTANFANSNLLNNKIDAIKSASNLISNLTYAASWCSTMKSNSSAYRVFFPNADNGNIDDIAIFNLHSTMYVRSMLAF